MPAILDVAIGTIFVFLLFSLVVSALNEFILSKFDQRAKFLHMGLQELFGEASDATKTAWRKGHWLRTLGGLATRIPLIKGDWTHRFYNHGLINALSRSDKPEGSSPSYVPAGAFVTALLDLLSHPPRLVPSATAPAAAPATGPATPAWQRMALLKLLDGLIQWIESLAAAEQLTPQTVAAVTSAAAKITTLATDLAPAAPAGLVTACTGAATAADLLAAARALAADLRLAPVGEQMTAANVESWIAALETGRLKESLQALFTAVEGDVDRFKTAVEGWFNDTMDRVSGWYKRFAQKWMIGIAFVLAAVLNVDTVRIVKELSNNPNLAKAVSAQAESYAKGNHPQLSAEDLKTAHDEKEKKIDAAKQALEEARKAADGGKVAAAQEQLDAAIGADAAEAAFQANLKALRETGIPLGWDNPKLRQQLGLDRMEIPPTGTFWEVVAVPFWSAWGYIKVVFTHPGDFLFLCGGWLLTAVAASLGAPFWFDLLGKLINIRSSGKAPDEKDSNLKDKAGAPASLNRAPGSAPVANA